MDISGHISEIGGNIALNQSAVDLPLLVVHIFHDPDSARDGDLVAHRRRLDDGSQLLGTRVHRVLDIFLKYRVELIIVRDPLSRDPDDQPAVLRAVNVVDLQKMAQKDLVVLRRDPVEAGQRQDSGRQLSRRHLAAGRQCTHGLVVEKAVGQPVHPGRLHEPLLDIELHQRDPLDQVPRDQVRQHGPCLRVLLPHHEPHLRGLAPAPGPTQSLQKSRHGKRRIDVEGPLQPPDIDAQLQRRRGAHAHQRVVVLHLLLRALAVGRR